MRASRDPSQPDDSTDSPASMLEVLKLFRIIFGSTRKQTDQVRTATGLGGAQAWALAEINLAPGVTVSELARKMVIQRSTAYALVDRLQDRGLLIKRQHGADQRKLRLELTEDGARLCSQVKIPTVGSLQQSLLDVPPETLRSLRRSLSTLIRTMAYKDPDAHLTPMADFFKGGDKEG